MQNKHIIYFNPLINIIKYGLVANYGWGLVQSPHLKKFGPPNSSYLISKEMMFIENITAILYKTEA